MKLSGWLAIASPDSPIILFVHGFKVTRVSMLPWARFLYAANFNVLLNDSHGYGASAGWRIGVGASEPDDVVGATRFLLGYHGLTNLTNKRFGALGVSLRVHGCLSHRHPQGCVVSRGAPASGAKEASICRQMSP